MAPAAVVAHLTAAGFGIRWAGNRLLVSPADQLTDELRALIREHRPALIDYFQQPPARVRRLWIVQHGDGRWVSHSFTPPASREEVAAWYPLAHSIEPEEGSHHAKSQ